MIICDYCGQPSELVSGAIFYPHRPDLADLQIYRCLPCNASVGCHKGTTRPLGRLANAELKRAKIAAHAVFDPLWKEKKERDGLSKKKARSTGYKWLAAQLGIQDIAKDCHIGLFDIEQCRRVVEICNQERDVK